MFRSVILIWFPYLITVLTIPVPYSIPEPVIQVKSTRGFRVCFQDTGGITFATFSCNINKPNKISEHGDIIAVLREERSCWMFEDNETKLNIGDKIYYRLFIIRDNVGYSRHGIYEVKEIMEDDHQLQTTENPHSLQSAQLDWSFPSESCYCNTPSHRPVKPEPSVGFYERALLNLTQITVNLQSEIDSLRDENNILQDIAEKQPTSSRTLKVDGRISTNDDPLDTVQAIIRERLHLPITVVRATRKPNKRIIFEVGSIREKMSVIKAAKEKLKDTEIFISY